MEAVKTQWKLWRCVAFVVDTRDEMKKADFTAGVREQVEQPRGWPITAECLRFFYGTRLNVRVMEVSSPALATNANWPSAVKPSSTSTVSIAMPATTFEKLDARTCVS
jgi:hypothetical protein